MDNLDIIDIVKRDNGIDEDFIGDFIDSMDELSSTEERFDKYMEIVQLLKDYDNNDLITPEKNVENMETAIDLLSILIEDFGYDREKKEYILKRIIEEDVFKDLLSCKHEDGKMASKILENFHNKDFSRIFAEYFKSYTEYLKDGNLEGRAGTIASIITYTDENGELKYNNELAEIMYKKFLQNNNREFSATEYIPQLRMYKGEDGKLYQGELEIPKGMFPRRTIKEIEDSEEYGIVPVLIKIEDVSSLSVEKIEELVDKGANIEGIIVESKLLPDDERFEDLVDGFNFYDIETYKKCKMKIDQYISEANIDYENLRGTPNIDKIVFGKIIRMLSDISYDHSALDAEKETKSCTARNLVGGLLQGSCVCAGYAEIVRNIFSCYGIDTQTIVGDNKTKGDSKHAWNKIKLDGQWYNLDLTQVAGSMDNFSSFEDSFLLKSDTEFRTHYYFDIKQPTEIQECFESIPYKELQTYMFGSPEQIAELPVRGETSKVGSSKSTENIINSLISSVRSTELHQSKQIVLESVAEKSPKQEEMQK